ncbi:glycosyltransferase family 2 protein [Candidatus Gottesmanbacteria bacterium]|nr:glycosyltransferase family 2 protein [Candidatus Gottesmanbacteria bacterium]
MRKTVSVSIIIPNWNGKSLLEKNLRAVLSVCGGAEILVVDDGSTDGSVSFLKSKFPAIRVVAKKSHEGFASSVNKGVEASRGDIVVLLNTDVVPEKGFIEPLLHYFQNGAVFAVGCMDKSKEGDSVVLRGRGIAAWQNGFFVHERGEVDAADTAWVSGGSGAFRKSIWDTLGGMDALYDPFYWEDIDLSYRARKAGYLLKFEPKSIVWHFHDDGKIKQSFSASQVKTVAYRNQFIFIWKNISDIGFLFSHALWTPVRILRSLLNGDVWMIAGYLAALIRLPKIIQSRIQSSSYWKLRDRELL